MLDLSKYNVVDLSPRMIARIKRLDGTIEEGKADIFGLPWVLEEGIAEYDNTKFCFIGGWEGDKVWPIRISGHCGGSHTEGGKGHLDHWEGIPDDVMGLWEFPLETFMGEAVVCNFKALAPTEGENDKGEKVEVGQAIMPEHLSNVKAGDIVLMTSPYKGPGQPFIHRKSAEWLGQKKIKMLAVGMPGVNFETDAKAPQPNNSPTHRNMLGNNIPITYPLVNIETLKHERVFYTGAPPSVERMDACQIRALAFDEK